MSTNPRQILEATETFATDQAGELFVVFQGRTRVAAGHQLAKTFPDRFRPVEEGLSYPEVEEATDDPGRQRARPEAPKASPKVEPEPAPKKVEPLLSKPKS